MVNEFHTIHAECSSLVPQGPAYANITLANQVCTTVGSVTGSATVSGAEYVALSYNYTYSHLWRVSVRSASFPRPPLTQATSSARTSATSSCSQLSHGKRE